MRLSSDYRIIESPHEKAALLINTDASIPEITSHVALSERSTYRVRDAVAVHRTVGRNGRPPSISQDEKEKLIGYIQQNIEHMCAIRIDDVLHTLNRYRNHQLLVNMVPKRSLPGKRTLKIYIKRWGFMLRKGRVLSRKRAEVPEEEV